jgi:protein SCO1/2
MSLLARPKPFLAALFGGALVVAGLSAGAWYAFGPGGDGDRFAECRATKLAGAAGAQLGGPFELTAHTGERMTSEEVIDRPVLLYFGYAWCPDVCPFDVARNAEAVRILEERGIEVRPVFVTVDPARDTPEALTPWMEAHHPRMIGLTGTDEEIAAAARAWRVYYAKVGDDPQDYLMDHSTFTYLMAPEEGFLDVFRREDTAEGIADRVQCFVERL